MRHSLSLLAALFGFLLVCPAVANASQPAEIVNKLSQDASAFLADGRLSDREAAALLERVDVVGMARFALGAEVRRANPEELEVFLSAFEDYLVVQMQNYLSDLYGAEVQIVRSVSRRVDDAIVETRLQHPSGAGEPISWRLRKSRDGVWRVVDIQAQGLWFAIEQRAQFQAQLDANGGRLDQLVASLDGYGAR